MADEVSCGIILFREAGQRLYLLLHYEEGHWDFPKGHAEEGESEHETAVREAIEETGISEIDFVTGFRERLEYEYERNGKKLHKEVFFFLGRTDVSDVRLSHEHIGYEWLPYEQALSQLTYQNAREILRKSEKALSYETGPGG